VPNVARLTVLGSLNMDLSVTVPALPAPGETVLGGSAVTAPGGKGANQAVAMARLGARVRMVGCVGDDDFGRTLRTALRAEGVDDAAVRVVGKVATGIAMITVDQDGENTITVAPGANSQAGPAEAAACRAPADALVISAEVPVGVIAAVLAAPPSADAARDPRPLTILNLAPAPPEAAELIKARPDWLVVNESEAAAILVRPVAGLDDAARAAASLVAAGARNTVVTAGAAGAAYCGSAPDQTPATPRDTGAAFSHPVANRIAITVPGFPIQARDTVGAGDTFVGALAVTLAAGLPPREAVIAAAAAGAAAAARPGTQSAMPRPPDIRAITGHPWPLDSFPDQT
jgi:ribokinase